MIPCVYSAILVTCIVSSRCEKPINISRIPFYGLSLSMVCPLTPCSGTFQRLVESLLLLFLTYSETVQWFVLSSGRSYPFVVCNLQWSVSTAVGRPLFYDHCNLSVACLVPGPSLFLHTLQTLGPSHLSTVSFSVPRPVLARLSLYCLSTFDSAHRLLPVLPSVTTSLASCYTSVSFVFCF
jgi:hypothetical protein